MKIRYCYDKEMKYGVDTCCKKAIKIAKKVKRESLLRWAINFAHQP